LLKTDEKVFDAAYTRVELADYMTALWTGIKNSKKLKSFQCAADHKAMSNNNRGCYPAADFLPGLDTQQLGKFCNTLKAYNKKNHSHLSFPLHIPRLLGDRLSAG